MKKLQEYLWRKNKDEKHAENGSEEEDRGGNRERNAHEKKERFYFERERERENIYMYFIKPSLDLERG